MKKIFSHLFYRIYWWNIRVVKESDFPLLSALLGISVFKVMNLSTLLFAFFIFVWKDPMAYPKWLHIAMMALVLIIDYFIYIHNGKYKEIFKKETEVSKAKSRFDDKISIVYILISILSLIWIILKSREFLGIV